MDAVFVGLDESGIVEEPYSGALTMTVLPDPLITSSPERLGGTMVFAGTRVPVQALIDFPEAGHPLDHFLDEFPSVTREH